MDAGENLNQNSEEFSRPRQTSFGSELKAKAEAILYCLPEGINTKRLALVLNIGSVGRVKGLLKELQKDYEGRGTGLKIIQDGDIWKFKIPDEYTELVKEAADPELEMAVLETLAYIAFRKGSRQCDVVRVRSNKAYDHIKQLIAKGFISSEKSGLTKFLKPTKKFYEYFKLKPGEKLKLPETSN